MTDDPNTPPTEIDVEIALLDRRLGMIELERGLRQQRRAAIAAHDREQFDHITDLLIVICGIEFHASGQPFVNADKIPMETQVLLRDDVSFRELVNTSLQQAIGKSVDFPIV